MLLKTLWVLSVFFTSKIYFDSTDSTSERQHQLQFSYGNSEKYEIQKTILQTGEVENRLSCTWAIG